MADTRKPRGVRALAIFGVRMVEQLTWRTTKVIRGIRMGLEEQPAQHPVVPRPKVPVATNRPAAATRGKRPASRKVA